jgi:hypothetical protein
MKRVHYYHADASALGGSLTRPINTIIPLQAPLSLSPAGGHATASASGDNFPLRGIISFERVYTQVSGSLSPKPNGGWTTVVTAVIEKLNVLNVVTADRVVAQASTNHPLSGYNPTVTFLGTEFDGLKIGGSPVAVDLDLSICDQAAPGSYPSVPCINDAGFLRRVAEQYSCINSVQSGAVPEWISQRYAWNPDQVAAKGSVLCSVVRGVTGQFGGTPFGNVLDVPNFGRIFLGELLVDCKSYQLTMIRLELGCLADGDAALANMKINGHTQP